MGNPTPTSQVFASIFVMGIVCGFALGVLFEGFVALGWFR